MALRRTRMGLDQMVVAPVAERGLGPVCLTCGRIVDYEEIVEGYPADHEKGQPGTPTVKVLVRHHGAEELRTFDMGSTNWDAQDLAQMKRRANWFDPGSFEGVKLGDRGSIANQYEDPEPKRVTSIGPGLAKAVPLKGVH